MKSYHPCYPCQNYNVAPFAGAWIEIVYRSVYETVKRVAPFAGAWIEIMEFGTLLTGKASIPSRERGLKCFSDLLGIVCTKSLPSRERGLKFQKSYIPVHMTIVAPFAGAWIEIPITPIFFFSLIRRSLRGSVD